MTTWLFVVDDVSANHTVSSFTRMVGKTTLCDLSYKTIFCYLGFGFAIPRMFTEPAACARHYRIIFYRGI